MLDVVFWLAGGAGVLVGTWALGRALLSHGPPTGRRCPACSYDRRGIGDRCCPECGFEAASIDSFRRRRSYRRAGIGLALALLGAACSLVPSLRHENRWARLVPTTVLIVAYPRVEGPNGSLLNALLERLRGGTADVEPAVEGTISRRQQMLLARRASRVLQGVGSTHRQRVALELLGYCGDSGAVAVPQLGPIVRSGPGPEALNALQILYHLGPLSEPVLADLVSVAEDPGKDAITRSFAIYVIAAMGAGARPAVPVLVRAIESAERCHRPSAIAALVRCRASAEALPALVQIIRADPHADGPVAAWAIGELGPDLDATRCLMEALTGARFELEQAALKALRRNPGAVETVIGWCVADACDSDDARRYRAVRALALLGHDAAPATPALISLLRDPVSLVRFNAVIALEAVGGRSPGTIDALMAVANEDGDEQVRFHAARAVIGLTTGVD